MFATQAFCSQKYLNTVSTIRCTEDYMDPKRIQDHKIKSHNKFPLYGIKCFTAAKINNFVLQLNILS